MPHDALTRAGLAGARHYPRARQEPFVRFARPADLRSIPSATGGIARLACARMRDAGKGMSTMLSRAGLTAAQIDDPGLRLEVRTQIKVLNLAAQELQIGRAHV